ncbi:hypothetical protein [Nannocystis radixulma]|uniref:Uncharacterized protein n=1 Tax=Nannocystis radixulma TaxID=2995305 RepID=A0ABT5BRA3_9BACT|nr:hypothetical protein [Nannocystis radixulma]MDC0676079.1 hypothetical protein [Nannocystis radixulma]
MSTIVLALDTARERGRSERGTYMPRDEIDPHEMPEIHGGLGNDLEDPS